jgi:pimeloyl-ACP methyl ester carboxylesterase
MRSFNDKIIILVLLLTFSLSSSLSSIAQDYTKTPVFFVHGYGSGNWGWEPLIDHLVNSGYPPEYLKALYLDPSDGANIPAAEDQIAPAVEDFLEDVNEFLDTNYPQIPLKTEVDIVSHSMGGLSSRWYAARVRPDRVRSWVSLAGANHGTDALCPWAGVDNGGAGDCCPAFAANELESYIQYQLNGAPYVADVDETPYGVGADSSGVVTVFPDEQNRILYVTIRTPDDVWISPDDSVILDGTGGMNIPIPGDLPATETSPGNIRMDSGVGHDQMLEDPDTMRLVGIILNLDVGLLPNSPLNFSGQKMLNRSLSQAEYINVLSWQTNPNNAGIVKYRIYLLEGNSRSLLVELDADTLYYWHRRVEKDKSYAYSLVAVDNKGSEGDSAVVNVY